MAKALHLICRRGDDGLLLGLTTVDKNSQSYDSCCWDFDLEQAKVLVGGWVYLHPEGKNNRSQFGGIVESVSLTERVGKVHATGVIFTIASKAEGRNQPWRGANHGIAWCGGVIEGDLPHEKLTQ
jgi:hypothetical protein